MREAAEFNADAEAEARRLLTAAFETAPVRPGLATDLAVAASGDGAAAPVSDVMGQVRRRAAWQRRARVLVPAGAVTLAAAVAGGVTAVSVTGGGTPPTPSARAVLTAAIDKTSEQAFEFAENDVTTLAPANTPFSPLPNVSKIIATSAGKFDPATGTGSERWHDNFGQHLYRLWDGGYEYSYVKGQELLPAEGGSHDGKPWIKSLAASQPNDTFTFGDPYDPESGGDPGNLLELLRSTNGVTSVHEEGPASGPGWTGTKYGYTVNIPRSAGVEYGTVSVDSSGRVRQIAIVEIVNAMYNWANHADDSFVYTRTTTFGDFGTPVSVTLPPASQVYLVQSS